MKRFIMNILENICPKKYRIISGFSFAGLGFQEDMRLYYKIEWCRECIGKWKDAVDGETFPSKEKAFIYLEEALRNKGQFPIPETQYDPKLIKPSKPFWEGKQENVDSLTEKINEIRKEKEEE